MLISSGWFRTLIHWRLEQCQPPCMRSDVIGFSDW